MPMEHPSGCLVGSWLHSLGLSTGVWVRSRDGEDAHASVVIHAVQTEGLAQGGCVECREALGHSP